jgi:hypothetical protein
MKSQYIAPKLLAYGDIDALTQFAGTDPANDNFIINGKSITSDGSTPFPIP